MAKTMSASKLITNGQIENLVDKFRAAMRKRRSEITAQAAQQILGVENLGMEIYEVIRKRVEAISDLIVRRVTVDRSQSPQQVLDATGRAQYTDKDVMATMPGGEGAEIEVFFFNLGRYISDADLEREYDLRNLKPDPYAQAAVNEADPAFADEYPNGTHWKDANGKWCFAAFSRWDGKRDVDVYRSDDVWDDSWWFAGVRK